MKRKREGLTVRVNKEGLTAQGLTEYHPIMKWLIDPVLRSKLEAIVKSVKGHNQVRNAYLGVGKNPLPLDVVDEMLEVTSAVK